jgi:hypothetical protein
MTLGPSVPRSNWCACCSVTAARLSETAGPAAPCPRRRGGWGLFPRSGHDCHRAGRTGEGHHGFDTAARERIPRQGARDFAVLFGAAARCAHCRATSRRCAQRSPAEGFVSTPRCANSGERGTRRAGIGRPPRRPAVALGARPRRRGRGRGRRAGCGSAPTGPHPAPHRRPAARRQHRLLPVGVPARGQALADVRDGEHVTVAGRVRRARDRRHRLRRPARAVRRPQLARTREQSRPAFGSFAATPPSVTPSGPPAWRMRAARPSRPSSSSVGSSLHGPASPRTSRPPLTPRAGPSGCFRAAGPVSLWCVGSAVGD